MENVSEIVLLKWKENSVWRYVMITKEKEYINRYDSGYEAMDRNDWREAYNCFNDCLEYLKYYQSWREKEIEKLEFLVKTCNEKFN